VVGVADGQPVTCAAVLMAGGYRYVAMVATDPSAQRRGYAAAAMLHALEVAARTHGWRPSFSPRHGRGKPIYERMGYAEVATHAAYIVADGDVDAHS
jgi:GNAT superfamily N-acetyltransferase